MRSPLLVAASLLLFAPPLTAGIVKPDFRCGPPLPRESVKVLDVTELPDHQLADFVREQVGGDFEIVKREEVQASTVFGRAWKKAEKQAAALGCPFVVLLGSWQEVTGYWKPDPSAPGVGAPLRKDTAQVMYLKPVPAAETATNGQPPVR
ncbi:MAG TPA: hypothetical protein VEG34_10785 [Thermoanaerobaculia bacterium]|nr:hypothetical protein [Thermoanaerobaculia bacterium]